MRGLLESCRDYFGKDNLYEILHVQKNATENEVKKGYYKLSLKIHPDRVNDDEKAAATLKLQALGKIYVVLSDKDRRAVYDETGEVDDDDDCIQRDRDWEAYWALLFGKITRKAIRSVSKKYQGSKEELEDLKTAYLKYKGRMDHILEVVMCSTIEDEPRFTDIIKGWIKTKEVPNFDKFSKETKKSREKRKRKAAKEAAEAEKLMQVLGMAANKKSKQ